MAPPLAPSGRRRARLVAAVLAASSTIAAASVAAAQAPPAGGAPPPAPPPPGYGQPAQPVPPSGGYAQPYGGGTGQPQGGYGAPYGSSGYGQQGYGGVPEGPPPPPPPRERREPSCCRYAIRYDPFDLIFRRATFQAEVGVVGPLSIEVEPSWIWGSPTEFVDEQGFAIAGNVGLYVSGRYLKGFYVKGHVGFETFEATLTHPDVAGQTDSETVSSPIFGVLIGSSSIWGNDDLGFNLSGGIGIGVAVGEKTTLFVPGDPAGNIPGIATDYYDKAGVIKLLGSLGLGVAF